MAKKFDSSKMKVLKAFKIKAGDNSRFIVEAYSYDGGDPKIGLRRQVKRDDGWVYVKAGGIADPSVAVRVGKAFAALAKYIG